MLTLGKVAVTGGISCGKSLVCQMFQKLGAYVVSADEIVHQLLSSQTIIGQRVIQLIGEDIVEDHFCLNRKLIGERVFADRTLLSQLESILHPAVREEIKKEYETACNIKSATLFVAEIPLLFETRSEYFFDAIVTVVADESIALQRFKENSGLDQLAYQQRATRQLSNEEKIKKATYVIHNNLDKKNLWTQVKKIYFEIKS